MDITFSDLIIGVDAHLRGVVDQVRVVAVNVHTSEICVTNTTCYGLLRHL